MLGAVTTRQNKTSQASSCCQLSTQEPAAKQAHGYITLQQQNEPDGPYSAGACIKPSLRLDEPAMKSKTPRSMRSQCLV